MKALLVYNSFSGRSKLSHKIDYIKAELANLFELDYFPTRGPKSITEYIINNGHNYDLVIAAGGDGTVHEAINGIMALDKKMKFAVIPTGTCNDLAKSLGYNKNYKRSVKIIKEGISSSMDVCTVNNEFFIYGLAAGRLTEISYATSHKSKLAFGKLSYYSNVLRIVNGTKPIGNIKLTLDDKECIDEDLSLFLATNSRYLAGFKLRGWKDIHLNDNKLQLLLIDRRSKIHSIELFARALLLGRFKSKHVRFLEASKIKIESENGVNYNTDGELLDNISSITVGILSNAINVIGSKKVINRYFSKRD